MPFLKLSTNVTLDQTQTRQLSMEMSQLMARETGKPERYVMVELAGDKTMLFAGLDEPLAYLECKSIGLSSGQAQSISASVSRLLNDKLKLPEDRIYIEFSDCRADFWGWNGTTFG